MSADAVALRRAGLPELSQVLGTLWLPVGTLVFLTYTASYGLPFGPGLLALVMIGVTQVLPGALLWRCLRPRRGWLLEDVALGFSLGIGLAVLSQIVGGYLDARWPSVVLPLAVAAALIATPVTRRRIVEARWEPVPWWMGAGVAAFALAALPQLLTFARQNRVTWPDGPGAPQVDQYFHIALAGQMLHRGPTAWPFVSTEPLEYHWLTHVWMAQVTASSGLGLDQVDLRLLPTIVPVLTVASTAALALRLSGKPWVATLAAGIVMIGGKANPWAIPGNHLPFTPDSPTLGLSVPVLLSLVAVLAMRWRGQARSGSMIALIALTVLASGTKGSTTPLVIAGTGLALVAMLLWRRTVARLVLLDFVVLCAALMLTVRIIFGGSAAGLTYNPDAAAHMTMMGGLLGVAQSRAAHAVIVIYLLVAGMSRGALAFALPFRSSTTDGRRDPITWVLIGGTIAGSCAPALFVQPGASQYYFLVSAYPLGAVGSALGVAVLLRTVGRRQKAVLALIAVAGGLAVYALPTIIAGNVRHDDPGSAARIMLVALGIAAVAGLVATALVRPALRLRIGLGAVAAAILSSGTIAMMDTWGDPLPRTHSVSLGAPGAVSQGQIDTARFIRNHSRGHDLVMSNRHCMTPNPEPGRCDNRRFVVAAFSERQVLLEGWGYSPTVSRLAPQGRLSMTLPFWNQPLQRLNDGFFTRPTAKARMLLWDKGVRWAYSDNQVPHTVSLAPYARARYHAKDGSATAWQLLPPPRRSAS
ncbi:hypothetical protein [Luteipulveratus mongoliensis]|uniref:Uncharacterized protein n=1 Tax=Luteipulveratus mongoliensis TaxID=571913 RepID=A0A0K1JMK7_9MICO|nr:hypothetical protein [Luteipulveratus mongoliensis]AKU17813.1 hypothetical protein VV02_21385 [Luteipulveratus mongoliensis]